MVTTGILSGSGDIGCQYITREKNQASWFNLRRFTTFCSVGIFFVAPGLHLNYSYLLPRIVPEVAGQAKHIMALKKLTFDQLCFAPVMTSSIFILLGIVDGKGPAESIAAMKEIIWATMVVNWKIWIPCNFLNFFLIPIQYQVLFANVVSLGYNGALSFLYNQNQKK